MVSFQDLPAELLHSISELLERLPDIYAFVRINRMCYHSAHDRLWRIGAADALEGGTRQNKMETVKKAIDFGADNFGHTLEIAVESGHESIAKLLLHHYPGDSPDRSSGGMEPIHGYKALHLAIKLGHASLAWSLLNSPDKVNLSRCDELGRTVLSHAADVEWGEDGGPTPQELENLAAKLVQGEADVDLEDEYGRTPLSYAAERNNTAMISMLLSTEEVDVNSEDDCERTPLSFAAQQCCAEAVEMLLRAPGILIDYPSESGSTPLLKAVVCWSDKISGKVVRLLVRGGANVNEPFLYAVKQNATVIIDEILMSGRVGAKQEWLNKILPFFYLARKSDVDHVQRVLDAGGVDPEERDKMNRTALSHAAECNNVDVMRVLLKDGRFDADKGDLWERTPLSYAVECGTEDVVDLLLNSNSVRVGSRDNYGRTPLSYAAGRGGPEKNCIPSCRDALTLEERTFEYLLGLAMMKKLLQASPRLNLSSKDNKGWTPLDYATDCSWDGRQEKVEFLKLNGAISGAEEDTIMSE